MARASVWVGGGWVVWDDVVITVLSGWDHRSLLCTTERSRTCGACTVARGAEHCGMVCRGAVQTRSNTAGQQ